jgi:ABC-type multidrug transport system fused ATPase/permease subunit
MNIRAWQYYRGFYRGSYRRLILGITAAVAQPFILLPIVLLVRRAFDDIIPAKDYYSLGFIGGTILLLYLINGGVTLYVRYIILKTTKIVIQNFREEILKKFYAFSRSYYSQSDRSKLHAIVVQDTQRLDIATNGLIALFLPAVLTSIALCGVLVYLNWYLFLILIGIAPLTYLSSRTIGMKVKKWTYDSHRSFESFSKGMLFVLQMMDLTRVQTAEHYEMERQTKIFKELRLTSWFNAWLTAAYRLVQDTLVASSLIMILIVGGIAVITGYMTIGKLLSFYVAAGMLKTFYSMISSSVPRIIEGNESLTTLYNILQVKDARPYSGQKRIDFQGKIMLESVHFKYGTSPVLRDIDLMVNPGVITAVVGPNGAGKSTIAHLMMGFHRPDKGQLYADGHRYDELDILHLRRFIGVVTQDAVIFPGTIWENIVYGHPEASRDQVIQASELATAHEFIQEFPEGYDTFMGEGGVLVSGGQGQRIAIARALLRQPKLLILDEPTNNLDNATARQLMSNLKYLDYGPATILISQDIDIVRDTKILYVLEKGRIVASGDPITLLRGK